MRRESVLANLCAVILALTCASVLSAQQDSVLVRGIVIDSVTGRGVPGVMIGYTSRPVVRSDSAGQFALWLQGNGPRKVFHWCPAFRSLGPWSVEPIVLDPKGPDAKLSVIRSRAGRCDFPPYAERRLALTGYWLVGFEANYLFVDSTSWAPLDAWGGPAARTRIGVMWAPGVEPRFPREVDRPEWPNPMLWSMTELWPTEFARFFIRPRGMTSCLRVRWSGRLMGPGVRDSLAVERFRFSPYAFVVDTSRQISEASHSHCESTDRY